ncbi:hypothetical protein CONPUDRAFT_153326 [Coniophora puteana RWD-64-598 SS2]|uniref:Ferritin-like domain-containing protein n=1 Tax=Coniophora puteana (strain RWD-64-598) TaxID=741705 RepID=A0A5M3MUQ8_CONPW|nr:uncharacterized protein CONPUDRAFT_153326 [Coniophora puteana RWD-64-598 SS2]EIW82455.1 hypothetical protein CONPUDRAFT_153326 [Coniophora puteana RWD-64-598 SS2]
MRPLSFLLFIGLANALFIPWRRTAKSSDITVLNFASVLEQMESDFYSQALKSFTASDFAVAGFASGDIPVTEIQQLASDENSHLATLQAAVKALGGQPITGCKFDFSSALTDVNTMITFAQLMENVGVSAYLGAASSISDPALLSAAASIMTVEARHQTVMNIMNAAAPIPQAFDLALNPSEVLSIAGQFLSGCSLDITATPPLSVTTRASQNGTLLEFQSSALNGTSSTGLYCQLIAGGAANTTMQPADSCLVPAGVNGPMLVMLTKDTRDVGSKNRTAANDNIVAGPSMIIIIDEQDPLGQLVRPGESNSTSSTTTSSTTTSTSATSATATASAFTTVLSAASASTSTTSTSASTSSVASTLAATSVTSTSSKVLSTSVSSVTTTSISTSTTSSAISATSTSAISTTAVTSAVTTTASSVVSTSSAPSATSATLSASGPFTTTISPSQASAIIASAASSLLAAIPSI